LAARLPADVAADDGVATEDGVVRHPVVDRVWHDRGSHRELDGRGVDDAHDVAGAGRLEDAEEGAVEAVLGVELDDLLVIVRALEELDARVERAAIGLEEHLHAVDHRVKGVRAEGTALDGRGRLEAVGRRHVDALGENVGGDRELDLANVADGHGVGAAGGLNHCAERAELAVLDVHAHLARRVVRTVPELDVSVERTTLRAEYDLHLLHLRGAVRPGAEGATLHQDGRIGRCPIALTGGNDAASDTLAGGIANLHDRGRRTSRHDKGRRLRDGQRSAELVQHGDESASSSHRHS